MADGAKPAASDEADAVDVTNMTIRQRLTAIRGESYGINKEQISFGDKAKFKAHTVEGVLAEIRPLLNRYCLDLEPSLEERTYSGNRCDVIIAWEFCCTDDETQTRTVRWAGSGTDNSDKAFAKAATNCLKEMLKKRFLITDRDDAKEEEAVEHVNDEGVNRNALDKARDEAKRLHEEKANIVREALRSAPTLVDLERLARENKKWISGLPDATRKFFNDLIDNRKRSFGGAEQTDDSDPDPDEVLRREMKEAEEGQ